jgi:putative ABC transport system substrate-binding protein
MGQIAPLAEYPDQVCHCRTPALAVRPQSACLLRLLRLSLSTAQTAVFAQRRDLLLSVMRKASGGRMERRRFLAFAGTAATWPLAARAQRGPMPVVGFLNAAVADNYVKFVSEFRRGLDEMGFVEGKNVVIEYRWAEGHYERLPELMADLINRRVTVIAATSTPAALVAKKATATIPLVFTTGSDPVELGLVASLARPGGNVTGATQITMELGPKRLEMLHQLLPAATTLALVVNPDNLPVAEVQTRDARNAARALNIGLEILQARTEAEFDNALANLPKTVGGLAIAAGDSFFLSQTAKLAAITAQRRIPAIFHGREFAAAGGLFSYGASVADSYHLAGIYTGRILNGEKPADLPVQRSSKVETYINLKTAKTLGITIPQGLVIAADEVFE